MQIAIYIYIYIYVDYVVVGVHYNAMHVSAPKQGMSVSYEPRSRDTTFCVPRYHGA
jgi:hypothetical protein